MTSMQPTRVRFLSVMALIVVVLATTSSLYNSFTEHLRTHSGVKLYQCSQCDKDFAQKNHLTTHMRTHSGEMPYKCRQCDKVFVQKSDLANHLRHTLMSNRTNVASGAMLLPREIILKIILIYTLGRNCISALSVAKLLCGNMILQII